MREEPRIFFGDRMYYIDLIFGQLIEAGNPDNKISIEDLKKEKHFYSAKIDIQTGSITMSESKTEQTQIRIPRVILEEGYDEDSIFAENFNKKFAESCGVRLVDKQMLEELENLPLIHSLRDLPTMDFGGFSFEIDVSMGKLRRSDQLFLSIYISEMDMENGKHVFYIDNQGVPYTYDDINHTRHEFDQMVKLIPDEVSRVYGISKDQLPQFDSDLRSHANLIASRIEHGRLPVIRLVNEDYYVDIRQGELRSCTKFWKRVPLNADDEDSEGHFMYPYDYLNRKIVEIPDDITELPRHTVFVLLPDLTRLDPVAIGRQYYDDPSALLHLYPVQSKMEARVIPLEQTFLPTLIKENREKLENQKLLEQKRIPQKRKKGFGL